MGTEVVQIPCLVGNQEKKMIDFSPSWVFFFCYELCSVKLVLLLQAPFLNESWLEYDSSNWLHCYVYYVTQLTCAQLWHCCLFSGQFALWNNQLKGSTLLMDCGAQQRLLLTDMLLAVATMKPLQYVVYLRVISVLGLLCCLCCSACLQAPVTVLKTLTVTAAIAHIVFYKYLYKSYLWCSPVGRVSHLILFNILCMKGVMWLCSVFTS